MRWLVLLLLLAPAWAQGVLRVVEAERLELRHEGEEEVYVLTGRPVRLEREGEAIEAERVVYLRSRGLLLLSGRVRYRDGEGTLIEAEELQLDLGDGSFDALTVRIEARDLLLTGPLCQRAAGAILLERGYATPCAPCGHEVPDYAFRAREILLYPGDRVVARGVVLLVGEEPLLELPVLLLFLSERQPRLEVGQDEGGIYLKAALPYVAPFGLGFALLHYYQGRGYGLGFDHVGTGEARERYFFLHTPPDLFQYRGEYVLRRREFSVNALLERDDTRLRLSRFRLEAFLPGTPTPGEWRYALRAEGFWVHDPALTPPRLLQRLPEVEAQSPVFREGPFSLQGGLVLGYYQAETNPLNRSARALGPYAGAGRALLSHSESLALTPWPGGAFRAENRFRGFYYTTQNPDGEYERQIDWATAASLRQTLGGFSLELGYARLVQEGESPFRFDALPQRRSHQATLGLAFQERPLLLGLRGGRDLEAGRYLPLEAQAALQDRGYALTLLHRQGLEGEGPLETRLEGSLTPFPFSLRASLRYDHPRALFDPLLLQAAYALPGGSLNLAHRQGLNGEGPLTTDLTFAFREGPNAYTLQGRRDWQRDTLALAGQAIFGPQSLSLQATLDPQALAYALGYRAGTLPGPLLDLLLSGRYQEGLRGTNLRLGLVQALPEVGFRLTANLHLPEVDDPGVYLRDLTFSGGAELWRPVPADAAGEGGIPGLAFSGNLSYARRPDRPEGYSLSLRNFGPTLTFVGREDTRLHLSALLTQNLPGDPLRPRFVLVLDRCCWALRFTLDAQRGGMGLAFLAGGRAAEILLEEGGVRLGGLP
ncbi:LPS-assembly protein LptD [Thermus thermamylovorans]|uniref:LPS-assembly protein LptD n=1 Tax=Thermus thermamylovorans TaxID=2509362 RepID=A0A4Q9B634_9DEIN|nr:LPS-assembly protein LptD [Thermus thermamylovorans]TBH21117.1 LPS-assembly protein LptD [Thermus thermamylovorans]